MRIKIEISNEYTTKSVKVKDADIIDILQATESLLRTVLPYNEEIDNYFLYRADEIEQRNQN